MRNILTALLASVLLACAGAAHAGIITYAANLNGISEAPPNASPGTGFATVTIDDILNTMRVQVTFSGLLGPTTASHIHCCTGVPGAGAAGVATTVPNFDGFPLGVMSGTYDKTLDLLLPSSYNGSFVTANGGTAASAEAALLAGMAAGRSYLNVHSTFAPGGEIRGFLTPVSEPTGFALLALGGVMLLLARRHRSYRS
ncbi:MAG: hypothetical protein JWP34_1274 [Massilia sp.]|nr:hypothetical protein [Massilia sp.]